MAEQANENNAVTGEVSATAVKRPGDQWIWGIFILLCVISLVESYSASSQEISRAGLFMPIFKHAALLGGGFLTAYVIQKFHYNKYKICIPVFAILTLGCVIYVMKYGENLNGALRSFSVFGISVQPSEMAKLSLVTLIAWITSRNQIPGGGVKWGGIICCAVLVLFFGALLYPQGFTNTVILMSISMAMMLVGGIQWKRFMIVFAVYVMCFGVYKSIQDVNEQKEESIVAEQMTTGDSKAVENPGKSVDRSGTRANRINAFDFSEEKCLMHPVKGNYLQEQYGYMARANGGLVGVMPGNSRECSRLPLAFSDYVYSIIIEEGGLVSGIFVMLLYLALLGRAGSIATKCKRAFPALLIMGMAVMIAVQALSHMAINSGLVPVTGQPLPFISKGGSSIIIMSIGVGLMLSVSRFAEMDEPGKGKSSLTAEKKAIEDGDAINPAQIQ